VGMVLGIAEALRGEFGVTIDAHPGGVGTEAGVVNRALRASAKVILGTIVPSGEVLDEVLTWTLDRAAMRRLAEVGVDHRRAEAILDQEPGLGDAWPGYLILAPTLIIEEVIGEGPASDRSPE